MIPEQQNSPSKSTLQAIGASILATLASCTSPSIGAIRPSSAIQFPEVDELNNHVHEQPLTHLTPIDLPLADPYELEFSNLPATPTIEPINAVRIFVANGAFLQHKDGSASNWMANVAAALNQRHENLFFEVSQVKYTERNSIQSSAEKVCGLILEELKSRPLVPNEEIVLMGHSQGALILSYAMHIHQRHPNFVPQFPWDKVRGLISVDIPLKVLKDYEGPYETIVDPLSSFGRKDPLVIPLLCALFYPSANDYLGNTEVLKVCKVPASGELRLSRLDKHGRPVQINVPAKDIDNPSSLWSHHLFCSDYIENTHEKEARARLLNMCLEMLKVDCMTDTSK